MSYRLLVHLSRFIYCVWLCSVSLCVFADGQNDKTDVRLIIDVSGSMKRNDPGNLRQPAVELLVNLLPSDSYSGVWTFGQWVNMLVPYRKVDEDWRQLAIQSSKGINSAGLFTHIGAALEKAAYDIESSDAKVRKNIILLTDGMVDIDKDPKVNQAEWRRIVDDILPKLKKSGYVIHTVALSDNADSDLMGKLSLATDGIAEVARSADELMKIFLKAFDAAAPSEQVALKDNQFVIDSSVEEFTALIFREKIEEQTQLIGPDNRSLTFLEKDDDTAWHRTDAYDLITIKRPLEGTWTIEAAMSPQSRITIVSNLNLRVKPIPHNMSVNSFAHLSLSLQEDGLVITRPDFLSLMRIDVEFKGGVDSSDLKKIWDYSFNEIPNMKDGVYQIDLPVFDKEGTYNIQVTVDGKTFTREFQHEITVRDAFGVDVKKQFTQGNIEYLLTVRAFDENVDYESTKIVATIKNPKGIKTIRPLFSSGLDSWVTLIKPELEGQYEIGLKIKGQTNDGHEIEKNLDDITFNFSSDGDMQKKAEDFSSEPEPKPEPIAKEKDVAEEVDTEPNKETSIPSWVLYVVLGLGNLVLIGIGFFLYKKIMGGEKEDILDKFSEENIASQIQTEAEPVAIDEAEEEPPMEDLDPMVMAHEMSNTESTKTLLSPDDAFDIGVEDTEVKETRIEATEKQSTELPEESSNLDTGTQPSTDMDLKDNTEQKNIANDTSSDTMNDEEISALIDGLDTVSPEASKDDQEDGDEDDMVMAMLKAQGLDLAEEELDNAIDSLIDGIDKKAQGDS